MHDDSAPIWREVLDRHHAALVEDLTAQVNAEVESCVTRAVDEALAAERVRGSLATTATVAEAVRVSVVSASDDARRKLAESLNQTLRRLRQTSAEHEIIQLLIEESATCSERAVVLLVENNQARIASWRGVLLREEAEDTAPIDLSEAAAMTSCVESRDPMVSLASPAEISPLLAAALSPAGGDRVYLFPIVARQTTVALMLAAGAVTPAPMELLCEAAGMRLDSLEVAVSVTAAGTPLVQIAGAEKDASVRAVAEPTTWSKLTPKEQAIHLKAQRTARVRVAQMRISESDALRKGLQGGDIYGALRNSIDAAREEFERLYILQSPTMVDYLHLEMVRSLAHDDSALLGKDYPGPIA